MRYAKDLLLEVKILDDGCVMARRRDRKPMTTADHKQARRLADSQPGITVTDVMRICPGAKVAQKGR